MHKKKSTKFLVTTSYKSIDLEFSDNYEPDDINIKWWRQLRATDSLKLGESPVWNKTRVNDNGFIAGKANFRFDCKPTLKVTLHRSKKSLFERKAYRFAIESIRANGKLKVLACTELDLSQYADATVDTQYIALTLEPKRKYVLKAVINMSLNFEILRMGDSKDVDMISTWSRQSSNIEVYPTNEMDTNDTFEGNSIFDLSVGSIIGKIQELKSDLLMQTNDIEGFMNQLSQCQLVIIVSNSSSCEESAQITSCVNEFYSKVKPKFGDKIELFYISADNKQTQLEPSQLACPMIVPLSQLHDNLTQEFEIHKAPNLIVLSRDGIVVCASDFVSIQTYLSTDYCELNIEKWLEPPMPLVPLVKQTIESADNKRVCRSLPNTELENKISCLRKKSLRRTSMFSILETPIGKNKSTSPMQAEDNVKATLMKRGVSGITGRRWRLRQFQYQNGKIIYSDPKKNEVKGHIDLSEVNFFDIVPSDKQDKNNGSFNIITRDRVFEMQARDSDHMNLWIEAATTLQRMHIKTTKNVVKTDS